MVDLSYYVLQPLISSIKTGNIWHDCIIIVLSVFCLTCISKMCTSLIESWQSFITSISWRRIKARYSIDISTNSSDILDTQMEVNISFRDFFSTKEMLITGSRRIFGSYSSSSVIGYQHMFCETNSYLH